MGVAIMRTIPRKRETFIALRARRTAYRVASEILNPHIEEEHEPYVPKTPLDPAQFHTPRFKRRWLVQPQDPLERVTLWLGIFAFSIYIVYRFICFAS